MTRPHMLAAALFLSACGTPKPEPVPTPLPPVADDPATPPTDDPPPAAYEQPKTGTCTATLKVVQLGRSGASCFIDEKITGTDGTLTWPCAGGRAEAIFGTFVFQGFITDGNADLLLATEFDFSDGCKWRSRQRISGAMTATELVFDYEEAPAPGQKQACASACTAKAGVKVSR